MYFQISVMFKIHNIKKIKKGSKIKSFVIAAISF